MQWSSEVQDALAAPFLPDEVEFLARAAGGGRALACPYIEARSVMSRLDAVVGPEGWEFDFEPVTPEAKRVKGRLTVLGVTKCDAGEARDEDEPLKAAVSDSLKRCGVHFGIARYLYALPAIWAPYDAAKKRWSEAPRLPAWALPAERAPADAKPLGAPEPESQGDLRAAEAVRGAERAMPIAPSGHPGASRRRGALTANCSRPGCGKPLNGAQVTLSVQKYGEPLCARCQGDPTRRP